MPRHPHHETTVQHRRSPYTAHPTLLREPSKLEALANTFSPFLSSLRSVGGVGGAGAGAAAAGNRSQAPAADSGTAVIADEDLLSHDDASEIGDDGGIPFNQGRVAHHRSSRAPRSAELAQAGYTEGSVIWSAWEFIKAQRHLVCVERDGLRSWIASDLDAIKEGLWLRWDAIAPSPAPRRKAHPNAECRPIRARVYTEEPDDVVVAVLSSGRAGSHLDLISTATASVVLSIPIPGCATELQLNDRVVAIGTRDPLALHLYSRPELKPLPCSPLTELVSAPSYVGDSARPWAGPAFVPTRAGGPVFALGSSRYLAYATCRSPPEREPPVAGKGFSQPPASATSSSFDSYGNQVGSVESHSTTSSRKDSVTTPADAVQTAKRMGEGLVSGARALSSWWAATSPAQGVEDIGSGGPLPSNSFSRSAPTGVGLGPMSGAAGGDGSGPSRRRSVVSAGFNAFPSTTHTTDPTRHGNIKIIDLFPPSIPSVSPIPSVVAHFRATSNPVGYLSFNPSSQYILSADVEGHFFDVFELRPHSRVGKSATHRFGQVYPPPGAKGREDRVRSAEKDSKVWHRYRLSRGFTTAEVRDVVWGWDSRVVAVATERGTHHLFSLHPAGGQAEEIELLKLHVANRDAFTPLSVNVSAFAKLRTKHYSQASVEHTSSSEPPAQAQRSGAVPALTFLGPVDCAGAAGRPLAGAPKAEAVLAPWHSKWPAALLFDGATGQLTLHKLEPRRSPVARAATAAGPTLSGLSQLMQRRASGSNAIPQAASQAPSMTLASVATAAWELKAPLSDLGTTSALGNYPPTVPSLAAAKHADGIERWTSFAEIDTFSRSIKILPRSMYAAHQFTFALLDSLLYQDFLASGDLAVPTHPLKVRQEVIIAPGHGAPPTGSGSLSNRSKALYGEPIRSAVETILDTAQPFSPESPSYLAPAFPNGMPGKQGNRWASSAMALTANVKPSLAGAHDFVRRVRRTGAGRGQSGSDAFPASVSFEDDDDAIRIDPNSLDHTTPHSSLSDHSASEDWGSWSDEALHSRRAGGDGPAAGAPARGGPRGRQGEHAAPGFSPVLDPVPFDLDEEWNDTLASRAAHQACTIPVLAPTPVLAPAPAPPLIKGPRRDAGPSPGQLSSSPRLAVPGMDLAAPGSSDSEFEHNKESRFVGAGLDAPGPAPAKARKSKSSRSKR